MNDENSEHRYEIIIKQIIDDLQGEIKTTQAEEDEHDPMVFGKLLGYAEALSIIQSACTGEWKKFGLDYDIDADVFSHQYRKKSEWEAEDDDT